MYAAPFDYYRASSLKEAGQLLQLHPGAKVLAGGHSLIPLLKMRLAQPRALVDISRIADLKGISTDGTTIRVGSLTTHAELCGSPVLGVACPLLVEAASMVGDTQVRNCGTIGGNIAHADPASDLPGALAALDARFHITGPDGERSASMTEFVQGMMTTTLAEDEILTAIEVPPTSPHQASAYVKFSHPASHYAVVSVAAMLTVENGTCTAARVAVGGLVPVATRCAGVEAALAGQPATAESAAKAAAAIAGDLGDDVLGDIYASAEYRHAIAPVYVARAIRTAFDRIA